MLSCLKMSLSERRSGCTRHDENHTNPKDTLMNEPASLAMCRRNRIVRLCALQPIDKHFPPVDIGSCTPSTPSSLDGHRRVSKPSRYVSLAHHAHLVRIIANHLTRLTRWPRPIQLLITVGWWIQHHRTQSASCTNTRDGCTIKYLYHNHAHHT